ncbi:MAG: hypothetical protein HY717_14940 [Planctomycetes bacterium]|nr:hypothetical protein [Planctomycetota bacterium]
MRGRWIAGALLGAAASLCRAGEPTYYGDVKPILEAHCTVCHAEKNLKSRSVAGGLALDSLERVLKGSKGPVVKPGHAQESEIIQRLREKDPDLRMPRDADPLPEAAIALIERWVQAGAPAGSPDPAAPAAPSAAASVSRLRPARPRDMLLTTSAVLPSGRISGLDSRAGELPGGKLELRLQAAPLPPVTALAFAPPPEGGANAAPKEILAVGAYGTVTLWDLAAGEATGALTPVRGAVQALRFSPDGRLLAIGGGQPGKPDLVLVEISGWKEVRRLEGHHDMVLGLAWSPDGKLLASGAYDKTLILWEVASGKARLTLTHHSDAVYGAAFLEGGKWIASCGADRSIKIAEVESGKVLRSLGGHQKAILALAASPDGKQLISSGLEPGLRFWDVQSGKSSRTAGGHGGRVEEIAFSRGGKRIASAGSDQIVRIWSAENGNREKDLAGAREWLYAVDFSADSKRVAAGSWDGTVQLWDIESKRLLATLVQLAARDPADCQWAIATPEGYFHASPELEGLARFRLIEKGDRELPAAQVGAVLRSAVKIKEALSGAKVPPAFFPRVRSF